MATTALLGSLALLLSYIETMIPLPFAVPGIKLGLANAAVLVALFALDVRSAATVALIKVLASGFLFGTPTMLAYSAGGTALALVVMVLCQRVLKLGCVPTSMASAICHNAGQLGVAAAMLGSSAVFLTLPPLAVAACVTGALIGSVASGVIEALQMKQPERRHIDLSALRLMPGEHVAFVGANGSGKTTAALQLAGLVEDGSGGARLVFQDPDDQLVSTIAQDDVAFGCENLGIELAEMRHFVAAALADAGADELAMRDVTKLSGGQKQQVAIAGVLAMSPRLVVFDEVTSMQDASGRERFAALVERLKARGVTVVTVTQIPLEAARADRVAVFDNCELAEILPGSEYARRMASKETSQASACELDLSGSVMLSGARSEESKHLAGEHAGVHASASQAALRLEGVSYQYPGTARPVIADVSLTVAPGCIVGLAGPSGSGKSTIAQIAAGYLVPGSGAVSIVGDMAAMQDELADQLRWGRTLSDSTPASVIGAVTANDPATPDQRRQTTQAFRTQVALVGQSPERALFAATAFEDVMFGARNRGLGEREAVVAVEEALRCVGIDPQVARLKSPFAFSGGERRRIALAGMLVLDAPYLILDEPDAGLDPHEVARLETLLGNLRAQGKGVLLISHNAALLRTCCDKIVELSSLDSLEAAPVTKPRKVGRWESGDAVASKTQSSDQGFCGDGLEAVVESAPDLPTSRGFVAEEPVESPGFGVYRPGNTLMHRLNPLVKLVGCVLFTVAGFLASNWAALGLAAAFCLIALAVAKTTPRQAVAALRPFAFLMAFVAVFDILFASGGDIWWQAGPVSLSSGGVFFAVQSVLRFALVALGTSTLMRTTSATQLADACSLLLAPLSKLGLHPDNLALSLGMTLRFIPLVQEEFTAVKRAQEARLADFNAPGIAARLKSYIPVFTPLFASCLRRSSALALAIENRAYGCSAKRTRFRSYRLRAVDAVALVSTVALLAASVVL